MPGKYVGKYRARAVYRLLALLAYLFVGVFITLIAMTAALIWMAVDLLLQFFLNSRGWTSGGRGASFLERLYYWNIDILDYIFFGKGDFPWLP